MVVRRWEQLLDCALWIRAAERIDAPPGGIVPGPLEIDPLPAATTHPDPTLDAEWIVWWHSLVGAPGRDRSPCEPVPEPAYDTPDPLGLAGRPVLSEVIVRRWAEVRAWNADRTAAGLAAHVPPPLIDVRIVQEYEQSIGRKAKPFDVELILLPVREDTIRHVFDHRYLVPERFYDGPQWPDWLRGLLNRIG
jgi:hypothetical protein